MKPWGLEFNEAYAPNPETNLGLQGFELWGLRFVLRAQVSSFQAHKRSERVSFRGHLILRLKVQGASGMLMSFAYLCSPNLKPTS